MRVRLIKKLAQWIDGVDLRTHAPGDVFDLSRSEARLLLAEGWAVAEPVTLSVAATDLCRALPTDSRG